MYLIERLLGLGVFSLGMFGTCIMITKLSKRSVPVLINIYIVFLAVLGYFFVPHVGADLYRIYYALHAYAASSFTEIVDRAFSSTTPGEYLYYYFLGKTHNDRLLPAVNALIVYSSIFYMLKDRFARCEYKSDVSLALFLFMSRGLYMATISGIRTMLALAIFCYCIYQEIYNNKKIKHLIVPYLICASVHVMGQVMLLYRILFLFFEKSNGVRGKIRSVLVGLVSIFLITRYGANYIDVLLERSNSYYNYAIQGVAYDYLWERILSVFSIILFVYLATTFKRLSKKYAGTIPDHVTNTKTLITFLIPLTIIDIITFFIEFSFFQRTSYILTILSIPIVMEILYISDGEKAKIKKYLLIIALIFFDVAFSSGGICIF